MPFLELNKNNPTGNGGSDITPSKAAWNLGILMQFDNVFCLMFFNVNYYCMSFIEYENLTGNGGSDITSSKAACNL
jgi:hypothetical protein